MISVRSVRGTPQGALIVVTVAIFTDMLLYGLVVPVLPGYAADLGISEWAIGVLFGSYSLASLVTTPVFGAFSDRVGRRVPMFCGLIGLGAATLLFASATSYPMLLTARMLQGVAAAATWTAGLALVADVFPAATRGGAMGTVLTGMTAGSLIGPPVGGLLFQWGGFRLPFIVAAAMCLLEGVLLLVLLREPPRQIHSGSGEGFRSLLRDRAMLLAAGAAIVGAAAWALLEPVLPLRLEQQFDFSPAAVGLLFGAATLVYGASAPWVGRVSDAG